MQVTRKKIRGKDTAMKLARALTRRPLVLLALLAVIGLTNLGQTAAPRLSVQRTGTNVLLTFTGRLQGASHLGGPYSNVLQATSPYAVPLADSSAQFWRAWAVAGKAIAAGWYHTV